MAKRPVEIKEPIMWGRLYRPRRETVVGSASFRPRGGLFATFLIKTYEKYN